MALSTELPLPGGGPHLDHIVKNIQREFLEIPGLRLTTAQAQRLWNLDALVCDSLFTALIDIGFIVRTTDGAFVRSDAVGGPTHRSNSAMPGRCMMNSGHAELLGQKEDVVADQIRQLRQENDDLRASALWWKHLYESAVLVITDRVGDGHRPHGRGGCGQDHGRRGAVDSAWLDVR